MCRFCGCYLCILSCLALVLSIIHVACNSSYFFSLIFLGEFKQSFARFLFNNTDAQSRLELAFWSLRVKEQIEDEKLLKPISYKFQEESIEIVFEWKSKIEDGKSLKPISYKFLEESRGIVFFSWFSFAYWLAVNIL